MLFYRTEISTVIARSYMYPLVGDGSVAIIA